MPVERWWELAECKGINPDVFFPEESHVMSDWIYDQGRQFCHACPVRAECLADVMEWERDQWRRFGLFGGLSPRERDKLAEKRGETMVGWQL